MDKIGEWLLGFLGDILEAGINILTSILVKPFCGSLITSWLETGDKMFSSFMTRAIEILQKSPAEWNATGWGFIVNNVNIVFMAFGSQLVLLFFLISFFAESVEPQKNIRLETIIKALFKILFGQYLVVCSVDIVQTMFGIVGKFILFMLNPSLMGNSAGTTYALLDARGKYNAPSLHIEWSNYVRDVTFTPTGDITTDILNYLDGAPGGIFTLTLLAAFVYMIVMIGAGGVIVYSAYVRFFKIMLIVPYGSMVSATVAGNHATSQMAVHYYKYIGSVIVEAVTIIAAICLYKGVVSGGSFQILDMGGWYAVFDALINQCIAALILVGAVKGSSVISQKVLA